MALARVTGTESQRKTHARSRQREEENGINFGSPRLPNCKQRVEEKVRRGYNEEDT